MSNKLRKCQPLSHHYTTWTQFITWTQRWHPRTLATFCSLQKGYEIQLRGLCRAGRPGGGITGNPSIKPRTTDGQRFSSLLSLPDICAFLCINLPLFLSWFFPPLPSKTFRKIFPFTPLSKHQKVLFLFKLFCISFFIFPLLWSCRWDSIALAVDEAQEDYFAWGNQHSCSALSPSPPPLPSTNTLKYYLESCFRSLEE